MITSLTRYENEQAQSSSRSYQEVEGEGEGYYSGEAKVEFRM